MSQKNAQNHWVAASDDRFTFPAGRQLQCILLLAGAAMKFRKPINDSLRRLARKYGVIEYDHSTGRLAVWPRGTERHYWVTHDLVDGIVDRIIEQIEASVYRHVVFISAAEWRSLWPTSC